MFSPGEWHKRVPTSTPLENLKFRRHVLHRAGKSKELRAELRTICALDVLFWVNVFCFTFDPRVTEGTTLPFVLYQFQEKAMLEIMDAIWRGQDLVILKSRDEGASWLCMLAMFWLFLYHKGNKFLAISRKEHLVDRPGDPDCLFWKLDFVLKNMPRWLLPEPKREDGGVGRRKLTFENYSNGSTINGESTTGKAGVGGRATAAFIDEFSRIEEDRELMSGTADTTRCRIFNFTPFGTTNEAYKLAQREDVRKLRLHWSEDPRKNQGMYQWDPTTRIRKYITPLGQFPAGYPFIDDGRLRSYWYDAEWKRRANAQEMAMMVDIDFEGSTFHFFDLATIAELQNTTTRPPYLEGELTVDPDTAQPIDFVAQEGGTVKLWLHLDGRGNPPAGDYCCGCDISMGTGVTNSCASFCNIETGEKIAEFATPYLRADAFAVKVVGLCRWLKNAQGEGAYLGWEMQGPGIVFSEKVVEIGYRNVFYRTKGPSIFKEKSDNPGWVPTDDNKRVMLEDYRADLAKKAFINRSRVALEECKSIIHLPGGKIEHKGSLEQADPTGARINHGDRVVGDGICNKLRRERRTKKQPEEQKTKPGTLAFRREMRRVASLDRQEAMV